MFKSLFGRLFTTYMAIILGSFILLGVILAQIFETYFIYEKEKILLEQGRKITEQYAQAYYTGVIDQDKLNFEMEVLDKYLNSIIWIVDANGRIYIVSRRDSKDWLGQQLTSDQIQKVFEGKIIKIRGRFGNYFTEPVVTVGYPIQMDKEVVGALFMHTPIPEIQKTVSGVVRVTMMALIFSSFLAFVIIYFLSRRITKPLKEMNEVAKVIAGGDFQRRLHISSEDEVGELANSFNYMADELNKLEELRKSFIANISHDLRSPLTSIKGFVQAILDGTIPPEKQEKYLHIVLDETRRLTKLTNDILDLTKMESGQMHLEKDRFEVNGILRQVLTQFEQRIIEKQIQVSLLLAQETTMVYADQEAIKRVIYNLIDNAVKFTPEEGQIWLETTTDGQKIWISVKNTGQGIPKEDLKYIWDRFHKVDRSRGRDKKGTGLGLSIVKQILKYHGEKVQVHSEHGKSITFTFSISLAE